MIMLKDYSKSISFFFPSDLYFGEVLLYDI